MIERVRHDVRYACRWLLRSPGFALVAILSLGIGIGANTAIFAILDGLLLRPLPVAEPARLIDIYTSGTDGEPYRSSSLPDLQDLAARSRTLAGVIGYSPMFAPMMAGDRSRLALGELVTGNYFPLLGVPARLGRTLLPEDDAPGAAATVVISEALWRRELAADPAAIGRTLRVRGTSYRPHGHRRPSAQPVAATDWRTTADVMPANLGWSRAPRRSRPQPRFDVPRAAARTRWRADTVRPAPQDEGRSPRRRSSSCFRMFAGTVSQGIA
jgi:hypothetical protein